MRSDVVIVGGGVLGLSLAYHLARSNISSVVLERESSLGVHASGRNAGMFRHLYRDPQLTEWAIRSRLGWPAEIRQSAFTETGSLVVGRERPGHHDSLFAERTVGSAHPQPAVFTAHDGLLDPYTYLKALHALLPGKRVTVRLGQEVAELEGKIGEWRVLTACGNEYRAVHVVNAAGAWLNNFLAPEQRVEASPYARHLFVFDGWPQDERWAGMHVGFYWDEHAGWYSRRWKGNSRLASICDTVPAIPESFSYNPLLAGTVRERITRDLAGAERLTYREGWHCFRTYTADQLPIVGWDSAGIFWLAAFGGYGMSTSFGAAQDAARLLSGYAVALPDHFSPDRFMDFQGAVNA